MYTCSDCGSYTQKVSDPEFAGEHYCPLCDRLVDIEPMDEEQYTDWVANVMQYCNEYIAMYPLSHYHGACFYYIRNGRHHCGKPFVNISVCCSGQVDEELENKIKDV